VPRILIGRYEINVDDMGLKPAPFLGVLRRLRRSGMFWNRLMACPEGLEPPTPSLEGWCSIQLSYGQREPGDALLETRISMARAEGC
jgi:hypothetical protein